MSLSNIFVKLILIEAKILENLFVSPLTFYSYLNNYNEVYSKKISLYVN